MRIACRIPKTADTQTEYVILIAFPLQQWLYECASILHYAYIVCLVFAVFIVGIGLCDGLITHSEESYRVYVI